MFIFIKQNVVISNKFLKKRKDKKLQIDWEKSPNNNTFINKYEKLVNISYFKIYNVHINEVSFGMKRTKLYYFNILELSY